MNLNDLPGAVNGASELRDWARRMGFNTSLVVDRKRENVRRTPVTVARVRRALLRVVPGDQPTSWLILYFGGHGTTLGGADAWYLSDSVKERRVVDIPRLLQALRRYGVERLTLISDACRNPAPGDGSTWTPDAVLPAGPAPDRNYLSDVIKATSPFAESFMLSASVPADARCLFSSLLVESLWGMHPEAFATAPRANDEIVSSSLANFLETAVAKRAAKYRLDVTPDITTGLRYDRPADGDVYARVADVSRRRPMFPKWPDPPKRPPRLESAVESAEPPRFETTMYLRGDLHQYVSFGLGESEVVAAPELRRDDRLGGVPDDAAASSLWEGFDLTSLEALHAPLFLGFGEHRAVWLPATMHPTRLPTVSGAGGLPQILSYRRADSTTQVTDVERLLAGMAAGEVRAADADRVAARVLEAPRQQDPMLGVAAAYLYLSAANWDGIRRLAHAYCAAEQPVPWDVAFLAHGSYRRSRTGPTEITIPTVRVDDPRTAEQIEHPALVAATERIKGIVAGLCPFLRQGWRLLDSVSPLVRPKLLSARNHLADSFITSFDIEGARLVASQD